MEWIKNLSATKKISIWQTFSEDQKVSIFEDFFA